MAFGQRLADQSSIQQDIAKSRIDIELCRLLVLKAAHVIDVVGNKVDSCFDLVSYVMFELKLRTVHSMILNLFFCITFDSVFTYLVT